MNSRRTRQTGSILPWQLPILGDVETGAGQLEPADRHDGAPSASAEAASPQVDDGFEPHAASPGEREPVTFRDASAILEQPDRNIPTAAEGYAQGLARGLEEGKTRGCAEGHAEGHAAGYAEGFAVGQAEGMTQARQAGQATVAAQARRLAALIERLDAPIPALERVVENAVVALALELARGVIGSEVARSRDYLVSLIREAVSKVPIGMGKPRLVMNFSDLELIQSLASDIAEQSVSLVGDDSIEPGGCLIVAHTEDAAADRRWHRTSDGVLQVDLTLPARWRAVMRTLFEEEKD